MDVYIQSEIGTCTEFTCVEDGETVKRHTTVVISPLRIEGDEKSKLRVVTGCNMFKDCLTKACYFSAAARIVSSKSKQ